MKPIWYHSAETGAPTLNNAAGSLIAVLDALLITGFNTKAVTSVGVSAGVATAVISGHGYEVGKTLLIAGATPTVLNGNQVITAVVDANTVRWAAVGVPDGAATGTITAKRAPLGWVKAFAGANVAMYARTDPQATGMLLRMDDTKTGGSSATYARAIGVETAGSVDSYTNKFPLDAQISGGVYISRGSDSAASKPWYAIGDGRTLYLFTEDASYPVSIYGYHAFAFGDVASFKVTGDGYACLIAGGSANNGTNNFHWSNPDPAAAAGMYLARLNNGIGGSAPASVWARAASSFIGSTGTTGSGPVYPSPVDNGMMIDSMVLLREALAAYAHPIRGTLRGVAAPIAQLGGSLSGTLFDNLIGSPDSFLCIGLCSTGVPGALLFNTTSAW